MAQRVANDPRCKDCSDPHEPGKARCAACLKRRREEAAVAREDAKAKRRCVVCGAPAAPNHNYTRDPKRAPPSTLCKVHQRYYAERRAAD
jgi:hypothetical protein